MKKLMFCISIPIFITACASPKPIIEPPRPVAQFNNMEIILASEIKRRLFTAKELRDRSLKRLIEACIRQGGIGCDEYVEPMNQLTRFDRSKDKIYVFIDLTHVDSKKDYEVFWKLFDPHGKMKSQQTCHISSEKPGYSLIIASGYYPRERLTTMELGEWRIETIVNGEEGPTQAFEIFDGRQERGVSHKEPPDKLLGKGIENGR